MKKTRNILLYGSILFCLFFSGLGYVYAQTKVKSDEVETCFNLIFTNPDEAIVKLDRLEKITRNQKDSLYSIVLNNKAIYYATQNNLDKAIDYFEKAYEYADKDELFRVKILNNAGITYRKSGNYSKSLEIFMEAEARAQSINAKEQLAAIYGEMALVFGDIQSYERAVELLLRSITYYEKLENQDPVKIAIERQKLGNQYFKMGQTKFALELLEKSEKALKTSDRQDAYALVLTSKADLFLFDKKPKEALESLNKAEPIMSAFNNPHWNCYLWELYARAHADDNNWAKSRQFFIKSLDESTKNKIARAVYTFTTWADFSFAKKDWEEIYFIIRSYGDAVMDMLDFASIGDRKEYYKFLGKWYKQIGKHQESNEALWQMMDYSDSLAKLNNQNAIFELQLKYQSESKEKENMILKQELSIQKTQILIVILLSLMLSISIYFVWRFGKIQKRLKTKELEQIHLEKAILGKELEQEKAMVQIKQDALKEREQNLFEQTMTNVALQEQLDELILKMSADNDPATLKKLKSIKQKAIPWNKLLEKFQSVNPEFNQKLLGVNDRLTKGDVEFCSMVRMNMSNKDIALVLQISVDSVFTKKYRLMKKLNLSKDTDLYVWLNNL
jgi:tetratricopeptide (TPR) repeat protein/DNA-binding CsgD family transcriptional regulator